MLFTGGDVYLVNPTARTFALFDTSMLQQGMAGMTSQLQFKDVSIEKVLDEAGDNIDGYPTRHYQFKSSWTMVMTGMPVSTQHEHDRGHLGDDGHRRAGGGRRFRRSSVALPPQVAEVAAAQGLRQVEGFPLKHVSVQTTKMDMGGGGAGALGGLGGLGARMAGRMMGGGAGNTDTTTTYRKSSTSRKSTFLRRRS